MFDNQVKAVEEFFANNPNKKVAFAVVVVVLILIVVPFVGITKHRGTCADGARDLFQLKMQAAREQNVQHWSTEKWSAEEKAMTEYYADFTKLTSEQFKSKYGMYPNEAHNPNSTAWSSGVCSDLLGIK